MGDYALARQARFEHVYLASNNGAIGGGEVMLLRFAQTLRAIDVGVTVVAPGGSPVVEAAEEAGLETLGLFARGRVAWMRALRQWDRTRPAGLLWCNGLVPSVATAGRTERLVHLHQQPTGLHRVLAQTARRGSVATLVPSSAMLDAVPEAQVLPNWTVPIRRAKPKRIDGAAIRIGFLGRLGIDKGVHVLAEAVRLLEERTPGRYRLVLGGEPLFVPESDLVIMEEALGPVARITHRAGWVDTADFFDTIDLLVVPSIISESFGLVAAEAMSAQVPLIVSDAGALPEVVGPAGHVVPAGDPEALAERIAAVASGEAPARRGALFDRWAAEYSPEAGTARLRTLVAELGIGSEAGTATSGRKAA
ncbi:glycosyltransferase [Microbacterium panaciterrae]|uniref:D-inositol 3-phosphate glycosyltransferase n=1 Tax=Microbacterium panaciterrae TaxID=985759 RepID=A0ABP8PFJ5_9MICO